MPASPPPPPGLNRPHFAKICDNGFGDGNNSYAHTMAWHQGRLYVGTTRANLCLLKASSGLKIDTWPVECTHPVYSPEFETRQARAEIWRYDPATTTWSRRQQAPLVQGRHGQTMSRELGYRGIAVFQGARDDAPALYLTTWSRSHGDGPLVLRSADGERFEPVGKPGIVGLPINSARALLPFRGRLYLAPSGAAGGNMNTSGVPTIYCTDDPTGDAWLPANESGFGNPANRTVFTLAEFAGHLYAGTLNNNGFELWKTAARGQPPYAWTPVIRGGAGRGSLNQVVVSMQVHDGALYLGTGIQNGGYDYTANIGPAGAEIIRVHADDRWELMVGDSRTVDGIARPALSGLHAGFGSFFNGYVWSMAVHDGWLYAGTMEWSVTAQYVSLEQRRPKVRFVFEKVGLDEIVRNQGGFDLWRSADGENWLPVDRRGFGNPYNYGVRNLVSTPAGLYLGTANPFGPRVAVRREGAWRYEANPGGGLEVWRGARPPQAAGGAAAMRT